MAFHTCVKILYFILCWMVNDHTPTEKKCKKREQNRNNIMAKRDCLSYHSTSSSSMTSLMMILSISGVCMRASVSSTTTIRSSTRFCHSVFERRGNFENWPPSVEWVVSILLCFFFHFNLRHNKCILPSWRGKFCVVRNVCLSHCTIQSEKTFHKTENGETEKRRAKQIQSVVMYTLCHFINISFLGIICWLNKCQRDTFLNKYNKCSIKMARYSHSICKCGVLHSIRHYKHTHTTTDREWVRERVRCRDRSETFQIYSTRSIEHWKWKKIAFVNSLLTPFYMWNT